MTLYSHVAELGLYKRPGGSGLTSVPALRDARRAETEYRYFDFEQLEIHVDIIFLW